MKEGLGLSEEDFKELTENLHVMINCAASVDFNAPLKDAIDINVFGTLRMFDLAQKVKRLESFLHVSTAYVNADKPGFVEEKVYDLSADPEKLINEQYNLLPDQVKIFNHKDLFLAHCRDSKNLGQFPKYLYLYKINGGTYFEEETRRYVHDNFTSFNCRIRLESNENNSNIIKLIFFKGPQHRMD